ncbi:hypothetical protein GCK32_022337, partial [Trichostrongylus colubriformis]
NFKRISKYSNHTSVKFYDDFLEIEVDSQEEGDTDILETWVDSLEVLALDHPPLPPCHIYPLSTRLVTAASEEQALDEGSKSGCLEDGYKSLFQ